MQVFAANGDLLFDSTWKDGNTVDWESVAPSAGTYRCLVSVRDIDGKVTDKEVSVEERAEGPRPVCRPRRA